VIDIVRRHLVRPFAAAAAALLLIALLPASSLATTGPGRGFYDVTGSVTGLPDGYSMGACTYACGAGEWTGEYGPRVKKTGGLFDAEVDDRGMSQAAVPGGGDVIPWGTTVVLAAYSKPGVLAPGRSGGYLAANGDGTYALTLNYDAAQRFVCAQPESPSECQVGTLSVTTASSDIPAWTPMPRHTSEDQPVCGGVFDLDLDNGLYGSNEGPQRDSMHGNQRGDYYFDQPDGSYWPGTPALWSPRRGTQPRVSMCWHRISPENYLVAETHERDIENVPHAVCQWDACQYSFQAKAGTFPKGTKATAVLARCYPALPADGKATAAWLSRWKAIKRKTTVISAATTNDAGSPNTFFIWLTKQTKAAYIRLTAPGHSPTIVAYSLRKQC